jgi:hypothetical protein
MVTPTLTSGQRSVVAQQVERLFAGSGAWQRLQPSEREQIRRHTIDIATTLAAQRLGERTAAPAPATRTPAAPVHDPYHRLLGATAMATPTTGTGTATTATPTTGFKAEGVAAGVTQAARMIREIDFPAFVSQLVHGTFDAVVQSSINQMKAYGELVRSVAMSLNEFRDQNVSVNQGRDHLVQRYPTMFQISTDDNGNPRVSARPGAENASRPDFRSDLGLDEDVEDLDDDTIESKLVPAARDDYARNRQKLLATMVLMGINRIVVTDGRINAKVQFTFQAKDKYTNTFNATDYENLGTMRIEQGTSGGASDQPSYDDQGNLIQSGQGNRYATGDYQRLEQPVIKIAETSQGTTDASVTAAGSVMGEVQLNFKSEVFPLEKMVDSGQMFKLNAIQQTPASGGPISANAAPATTAAPSSGPASAPAPAPAPAPGR